MGCSQSCNSGGITPSSRCALSDVCAAGEPCAFSMPTLSRHARMRVLWSCALMPASQPHSLLSSLKPGTYATALCGVTGERVVFTRAIVQWVAPDRPATCTQSGLSAGLSSHDVQPPWFVTFCFQHKPFQHYQAEAMFRQSICMCKAYALLGIGNPLQ